jgi:hypothetical protein
MAEDEFSSVPSSMKGRRPSASSSSSVRAAESEERPRERMRAPEMPKISAPRMPNVEMPKFSAGGSGNGAPNIVVIGIGIIALLALYLAFSAYSEVGKMKAEARGVADDLRSLRDKDALITAPIQGTVTIRKDVPVAQALGSATAVGTLTIPIRTTMVGRSTTGTVFEVPIDQNITVDVTSLLDFSGSQESIAINEEIPVESGATMKVSLKQVAGDELNSMIDRLESVAK